MLAGLLFATHDADERPDRLAATLPFGGVTLIEYQARLLIAAGVSQIVVVVARLTPELLGAINRIGRRGVTVDAVRTANEASEKFHPLARILMLADGLITTQGVVQLLAGEGEDALMVVDEAESGQDYERVGGRMAWAGVARIDPRRLAEVAALPRDYDMQSALIRLAAQAQAAHMLLPPGAVRDGHGIEYRSQAMATRGRAVLASIVSDRTGWFDRMVLAPIARLTLPGLVARHVSAGAVGAGSVAVGLGGLSAIGFGWMGSGMVAAWLAGIGLSTAATLAALRDDATVERGFGLAVDILPALAVLVLGYVVGNATGDGTALTAAIAAVVIGALGERAVDRRRTWWGRPPVYLLVATVATIVGLPVVGIAAAAVYAAATSAAAIDDLRRHA